MKLTNYLRKFMALFTPAYESAGTIKNSMRNWLPSLFSANTALSNAERRIHTARAEDSYRNDTIARAAVDRIKQGAVATGLKLHPTVDAQRLGLTDDQAEELEDAIETEFEYFSEECDIERNLDLDGLQLLTLGCALLSGDCFVNTPYKERPGDLYGLKFQIVDSVRASNPNSAPDTRTLQKGVEKDEWGAPVAYHFQNSHPSELCLPGTVLEWERVPAFSDSGDRRVFHVYDKTFAGQSRGVSCLSPVLSALRGIKQYSDAEILAAVLTGSMTFFMESDYLEDYVDPDESNNFKPGFKEEEDTRTGDMIFNIGNGAMVKIPKGYKINMANPTRPNASYEPFMLAAMRQIAAALSVPLDEVILRFDSSYSAARAAMLKAWQYYRIVRKKLVTHFLKPGYILWFNEAVSRGALPHIRGYGDLRRRKAYQESIWIAEGRGAIDELKEAQAAENRLAIGISSLQDECMKLNGTSLKAVIRQQKRALRLYSRAGIPLPPSLLEAKDRNDGERITMAKIGGLIDAVS